jgi:pimeloyl-ACP methyl ester carboxylesterase
LAGLSEDEVARLIAAIAGRDCDAELGRTIYRHTEGNPLFVEEVYNYLSETGALHEREGQVTADLRVVLDVPEGVKDLIGRRLSQLSDDCNSLLNIAAVTGREFGLDALERAGDLPVDRLLDLLEEAEAAGVVREMPEAYGRYEFIHSLTFDTIYDELTSTRRVRLHGQTLQYADNEGVKLAYEVLGTTGPYVVALGISNCPSLRPRHRAFAEHWDRVAQDCRLILYDRRGVGSSAAPDRGYSLYASVKDLEAVLDAVGAQRVILWGAVDGGPLAIQFAVGRPDRVAALLLLSTSPKLINGDGFEFGMNPAVIQAFTTMGSTDRDRVTGAALDRVYDPEGSQTAIVDIMHRVPEHAWNKVVSGAHGGDVRDQLADVRVPTLIVHDPDNDYIPVDAAYVLHDEILDSELEVTEEYAPFPLREGGYRRIAAFIEKVARGGVL